MVGLIKRLMWKHLTDLGLSMYVLIQCLMEIGCWFDICLNFNINWI